MENTKTLESRRLTVRFVGDDMESGVVDANDFSQTVSALVGAIQGIHELQGIKDHGVKVNIYALRGGSFDADLVVSLRTVAETIIATLPLISTPSTIEIIRANLDILKALIRIRKFLGGEKPRQVTINQDGNEGSVVVQNFMGDNTTVNIQTYNALQSDKVRKQMQKFVKPLLREDGEIKQIQLQDESQDEPVEIAKHEAEFFEKAEELQSTPDYRLKGVVSALDRKTGNGRLTVGDKRISFEILLEPAKLPMLDKILLALIDSMKFKISVILIGDAILDFEGSIKKFTVKGVEGEQKLIQ